MTEADKIEIHGPHANCNARATLTKQSKGERTRARLLEASAAEFASRGFHDTKVSDIVARAGLTQPSFYLYFANKEAAYDELVAIFRRRLRDLVSANRFPEDQDMRPDQIRLRIHHATHTIFEAFDQDRNLTEIGFFQCPLAEEIKTEYACMIAGNILEDQQRGLLRRDIPAELLAQFIVGMVERIIRMKVGKKEREAHVDAMTAFIADGFHAGCERLACPSGPDA
ncbi:MAG: TetR/AcrR family transcriptional regulator [Parvibaculaceae bacterium]|nr:TetR/AcrR family transcriptional regulator [Parvibaculaceae bacterium]